MPSPTKLDLIAELWQTHGPLALGWIVACFLAVYVVVLHARIYSIMKEYTEFAKTANSAVAPVLEKAVAVMTQIILVVDSSAEASEGRGKSIEHLKGQLEVIIKTFIESRTYVDRAFIEGGERASRTVKKLRGSRGRTLTRPDEGE